MVKVLPLCYQSFTDSGLHIEILYSTPFVEIAWYAIPLIQGLTLGPVDIRYDLDLQIYRRYTR